MGLRADDRRIPFTGPKCRIDDRIGPVAPPDSVGVDDLNFSMTLGPMKESRWLPPIGPAEPNESWWRC